MQAGVCWSADRPSRLDGSRPDLQNVELINWMCPVGVWIKISVAEHVRRIEKLLQILITQYRSCLFLSIQVVVFFGETAVIQVRCAVGGGYSLQIANWAIGPLGVSNPQPPRVFEPAPESDPDAPDSMLMDIENPPVPNDHPALPRLLTPPRQCRYFRQPVSSTCVFW